MRAEDFTPDIAWGTTGRQYRRRRTPFGRDMDRLLRWLRDRLIPVGSLLVVVFIAFSAYMVQAEAPDRSDMTYQGMSAGASTDACYGPFVAHRMGGVIR